MNDRILNVGVVGFGYATATFHAPLIDATPGLRLAAIASSAPDRVRLARPGLNTCSTPAELFARADIDLVVVPTPNQTHHPLAMQALLAGKHVVVDKPFTLDVAQAHELIALADRQGLQLSVFHNRRWDADFLTVSRLLAAKALGRLTHFESHFDRYRPAVRPRWRESADAGGGLWYDLGPHLLDQALQLFGKPEAIWLDVACQRDGTIADDWFHAVLHYGSLRAILHGSALTAQPAPRFVLHGTGGSFVKHGLDCQEAALGAGEAPGGNGWGHDPMDGQLTVSTAEGLVETPHANVPGNYPFYYAAMRSAILFGTPVPVTASSACDVIELIETGLESARSGRRLAVPH
jgi:predicted dehydrogenase